MLSLLSPFPIFPTFFHGHHRFLKFLVRELLNNPAKYNDKSSMNTNLMVASLFTRIYQGWEFAHLISERIARLLSKNERMSHLLKKMRDSLIRSFLVSDLSDSLTIAHFL